jgi:hypothetical protein
MDAMRIRRRPNGPRWTGKPFHKALVQSMRKDSREKQKEIHDNESALASHTYRRSIQESLACEDVFVHHIHHPIDIHRSE